MKEVFLDDMFRISMVLYGFFDSFSPFYVFSSEKISRINNARFFKKCSWICHTEHIPGMSWPMVSDIDITVALMDEVEAVVSRVMCYLLKIFVNHSLFKNHHIIFKDTDMIVSLCKRSLKSEGISPCRSHITYWL